MIRCRFPFATLKSYSSCLFPILEDESFLIEAGIPCVGNSTKDDGWRYFIILIAV